MSDYCTLLLGLDRYGIGYRPILASIGIGGYLF